MGFSLSTLVQVRQFGELVRDIAAISTHTSPSPADGGGGIVSPLPRLRSWLEAHRLPRAYAARLSLCGRFRG